MFGLQREVFFSKAQYEDFSGKKFKTAKEAIEDYLNNDEAHQIVFSKHFDSDYYVEIYPDVMKENLNPFYHYMRWGALEGRVISEENTNDLIVALLECSLFDEDYFVKHYKNNTKFSTLEFAVMYCGFFKLNESYDPDFVQEFYFLNLNKFQRHFQLSPTKKLSFYQNINELPLEFVELFYGSDLVQLAFYNEQLKTLGYGSEFLKAKRNAVIHYICEGASELIDPSEHFSTKGYLLNYPDIKAANLNPLAHYLTAGVNEYRVAGGIGEKIAGKMAFKASEDTVIIVSHEASKSGAPIVGLELCRYFSNFFNVIAVLGKSGPLLEDFCEFSTEVFIQDMKLNATEILAKSLEAKYSPTFVICNSAETFPLAYDFANLNIRLVSLIHEFSEYARPAGRLATLAMISDLTIVPAELVKDSLEKDSLFLGVDLSKANICVRHQGVVAPSIQKSIRGNELNHKINDVMRTRKKTKVVLGCGWVQPRKGVYKFFETARRINEQRDDVLFVWVGANYDPYDDANYCAFINDFLAKSHLHDDVLMIDHLENLDAIWSSVDCLFMSSLLDPFPNVAMDSLIRGIPVVCFEGATGIAELASTYPELVGNSRYLDEVDASDKIIKFLHSGVSNKDQLLKKVAEDFSYEVYCDFIAESIKSTELDQSHTFTGAPRIPNFVLSKMQCNYVYDVEEKAGFLKRVIPFYKERLVVYKTPMAGKNEIFRFDKNPIVVLDFYGAPNHLNYVMQQVHFLKEKISKAKIIVMVDGFSPLFNKLSKISFENNFSLTERTALEDLIVKELSFTSLWKYEFIHCVMDKDTYQDLYEFIPLYIENEGKKLATFLPPSIEVNDLDRRGMYKPSITLIDNEQVVNLKNKVE